MQSTTVIRSAAACVFFAVMFTSLLAEVQAQHQPGSMPGTPVTDEPLRHEQGVQPFGVSEQIVLNDEVVYNTTVFTFGEIVVFSYSDDTEITILNSQGEVIFNQTLQKDDYHVHRSSSGIYRIFGSRSFTTLVGDATSGGVHGWYAVDQSGRGTSTLFNTYMMRQSFGGLEEFIVAAYENNTEFTIRNLNTGDLLSAGVLQAGEFFTMPNTPYNTFLQVAASKPVSALSYGDTDYYVPSANGTFAGTLFLGYSAFIGNWTNSITVTGYHDNTEVRILNVKTGELIAEYTLHEGQVNSYGITSPTYWRLESDKPVVAANIPYAGWTHNYYYMSRAIDRDGIGAGKLFYMPTIGSRIDVFSFEDQNEVKIERLGQDTDYPYADTMLVFEGVLDAGEGYTFNSPNGRWMYRIEGLEDVSVIQSNGGAGAEFMPLSFAQQLPDLAVSSDGILFNPEKESYQQGERIDVTIRVFNYGPVDAEEVAVHVYDGDPDGEGLAPLIYSESIPLVRGNSSETVSFLFTVPSDPQYREIVVKVDPDEQITESNNANNKASRFIIPNEDLYPPVAVTVQATGALRLSEDNQLEPNPFTVTVTLLNTGEGTAQNVEVDFIVYDGLSIVEEPVNRNVGDILPGNNVVMEWAVRASESVTGANRYTIRVDGSNMDAKEVNRAVIIPGIPLAAPANLRLTVLEEGEAIQLDWDEHPDPEVTAFQVYRGAHRRVLELVAETGPQEYRFTDSNPGDGSVVYAVRAVRGQIRSSFSNVVGYFFQSIPDDWILISVPVAEAEISLQQSQAFSFDQAYKREAEIGPGRGFWVKSAETETIFLEGQGLSTVNLTLNRGWNLIGSLDAPVDRTAILDPSGILSEAPVYRYDGNNYVATEILEPGKGHWIHALAGGAISMDAGTQVAPVAKALFNPLADLNDYGSILFSSHSASGRIYVTEEPVNENVRMKFLLPPKSPSPKLEVRTSDHYALADRLETVLHLHSREPVVTAVWQPGEQQDGFILRLEGGKPGERTIIDLLPGQPRQIPASYQQLALRRIPVSEAIFQTALLPAYPNPFNPVTNIRFHLVQESAVDLHVYDLTGRRVATLIQDSMPPGSYSTPFDAAGLSSGVYIIRLQAGGSSDIQRITFIK